MGGGGQLLYNKLSTKIAPFLYYANIIIYI